jgi:YrbI family 3-deoxy-D-manno-octulosonate 8-phosphate phosphatase
VERLRRIKLFAFDFDGVFTDNMVYVIQGGMEAVRCSRSDGLGLRRLELIGVEPVIISTETNSVVKDRSNKLKIRCFHGCADKLAMLEDLMDSKGIDFEAVAYLGNDINDTSCLQQVGFPMVVQDAHPDVIRLAIYQTNTTGGQGAVREVCDMVAHYHMNMVSSDQR